MTGVIENFDRSVAGYEAHSAPQAALAAALAQWILPSERHGVAIEFGAGTGLFTQQVQPWKGTYTATDAAPGMIQRGKTLVPAANWKIADARQSLSLGPADWIFACNMLQWVDNPEAVLGGWRKIAAAEGQIALAVLLPETFQELEAVLPGSSPVRWHTADAWSQYLEGAGFAIERASEWRHIAVAPSALAWLRSLHAMGLAPRRTMGAGRLRTALRHYDEDYPTNGGVRATWAGWLMRGRAL